MRIFVDVVLILFLIIHNLYWNISVTYSNLDTKINVLRKKYSIMLSDKRIEIDICEKANKIGGNRDRYKYIIGNNCEPWIARECIFILDHILPLNGSGLEWSSGSSTLWLSYRLYRLVSVENLKGWYDDVKSIVSRTNTKHNIMLLWFDKDNLSYCKNEKQYITYAYGTKTCLKTYATSKTIPNIIYDFISVDGRVRTGCFLRAIKMIKKENGIILLDNAERKNYNWIYNKIPSSWSRFDFWYKNGLASMFITHEHKRDYHQIIY